MLRSAAQVHPEERAGETGPLFPRSHPGDAARASRLFRGLLLLAATGLLASLVYPFASALLFAAVLAGALHPFFEQLAARLGGRRDVAAGLLTLSVALLLLLPLALLSVTLGRQVVEGVRFVHTTLRDGGASALVEHLPASLQSVGREVVDGVGGGAPLEQIAGTHGGEAAAAVGGALLATSGFLLQMALMVVAFFFLLVDGPRLVNWAATEAPLPNGQILEILTGFRNVSVAVLISSVGTAGVQSAAALVGFLAAGVPQPLFFALVTFLIAFIPAIGATSVSIGLSGLLFLTGHTGSALFLALWGLTVVAFIDNIVKPLLMKGRMEIHGALIFFSLIGGMATFGPAGFLAGPLILSFFLAVVRLCRPAEEKPS